MNGLNASLETSKPNNTPNSEASTQPNKVENQPNKDGKTQEPVKPKAKTLGELFADPKDESSTEINLDDDTPDDPDAPLDSIERLMKRNKLTPEQVYAIKVPMPNGAEPLTIGELKDKISDLTDHEIRVTEFEERRIRTEGELLRSQHELRDLLAVLPKDAVKPELLAKVRSRQDALTKVERQRTLEVIPEWRDDKKRDAEFSGIQEMLSDYGFDESFFHSVQDHRAMKFIRDTFLIRARIRKSLEAIRDPKKVNGKPSGKSKAPIKPNANQKQKSTQTQTDRIADWFRTKE